MYLFEFRWRRHPELGNRHRWWSRWPCDSHTSWRSWCCRASNRPCWPLWPTGSPTHTLRRPSWLPGRGTAPRQTLAAPPSGTDKGRQWLVVRFDISEGRLIRSVLHLFVCVFSPPVLWKPIAASASLFFLSLYFSPVLSYFLLSISPCYVSFFPLFISTSLGEKDPFIIPSLPFYLSVHVTLVL